MAIDFCYLVAVLVVEVVLFIEQPLVGEERYVTTRITAAKETRQDTAARSNGRALETIIMEKVKRHDLTF